MLLIGSKTLKCNATYFPLKMKGVKLSGIYVASYVMVVITHTHAVHWTAWVHVITESKCKNNCIHSYIYAYTRICFKIQFIKQLYSCN